VTALNFDVLDIGTGQHVDLPREKTLYQITKGMSSGVKVANLSECSIMFHNVP